MIKALHADHNHAMVINRDVRSLSIKYTVSVESEWGRGNGSEWIKLDR